MTELAYASSFFVVIFAIGAIITYYLISIEGEKLCRNVMSCITLERFY